MKLFAFRDRRKDQDKELGRHHALDLYSLISLISETEWQECLEFSRRLKAGPVLVEAGKIVSENFSDEDQLGILRLREHAYFRPGFQLTEFISILKELFGV